MKNIFSLLSLMLVLTSCENFFESTVNIDPPKYEDQMTISAVLNNQDDTLLQIGVGRTTAIIGNEDQDLSPVNDATVKIHDETNNQTIDFLPTNTGPNNLVNYNQRLSTPIFQPGNTYRLEVTHPNFPAANSRVTVPNTVPAENYIFDEEGILDLDGYRLELVEFELQDPPEEENYYEAVVFVKNGSYYTSMYSYGANDFELEESLENGVLLSDRLFNGERRKVRIGVDVYGLEEDTEVYLLWKSVTKDYYEFVKGVVGQNNDDDNPFSSPITIKSNVENGLGLFTINNHQVYRLR